MKPANITRTDQEDVPNVEVLARTLRFLANRYFAEPGRADRDQSQQNTARTNAAQASATLRQRRHDREEVDDYLQSRTGHRLT